MPITVGGTSITFNDSTTQTTAFTGGGGVTSLNGQTGAVTTTNINSVGSFMLAAVNTTGNVLPNNTYSGGDLYYVTTISQLYDGRTMFIEGSNGAFPRAYVGNGAGGAYPSLYGVGRNTNGNTGFTIPGGMASLSGTWRALTPAAPRNSSYNSCDGQTSCGMYGGLFVRVS
jgi:hypothetical protein